MSNVVETHEMRLERKYPSGAQEWLCPECGRHFIVQWAKPETKYKKIILDEGDQHALHTGANARVLNDAFHAMDDVDTDAECTEPRAFGDFIDNLDLTDF